MKRELFSIGPLHGTNNSGGRIAYFVNPALPDLPVVFGNSLADVMETFAQLVPQDSLYVDEKLRDQADELNLRSGALSQQTVTLMGTIALDLASPDAFAHCDDPDTIRQFMSCAAAFVTSCPDRWAPAGSSIDIRFETEPDSFTGLIVAGPGLCILTDPLPVLDNPRPEDMDGMAMIFAQSQPAVDDILNRVFSVAGVPEPFALASGCKLALPEAGLARLGAAMKAAARLQDPSLAAASADFPGQSVTATAHVQRMP